MTYGATDEVGHKAAENVVTPNDFQATLLHLLGLDHTKLVYHARRQGPAPHRRPTGPRREGDPGLMDGARSQLTGIKPAVRAPLPRA